MIVSRSFAIMKNARPCPMDGDHAGSDVRSFGFGVGEEHPEASSLLRLDWAYRSWITVKWLFSGQHSFVGVELVVRIFFFDKDSVRRSWAHLWRYNALKISLIAF